MRTRELILSSAAFIALCVPSAFAQSTPATATNPPQTIQQRKVDQQDRIAQGVQSGQLTAGETKNLETKEAGINHEEHAMRTEDNGHLTAADRSVINHQQNHLSKQIYNKKHNGRTRG